MSEELTTEAVNPATVELDRMSSIEFVRAVNREDAQIAAAVAAEAGQIAQAIDVIAARMARGGRLVYVGAGTSGRLGVLDAAECPPTFNAEPDQVIALIAGGHDALLRPVEGAEDSSPQGAADLNAVHLTAADAVVGIAASGATPYVIGALEYANKLGAATIGFSCNRGSPVATIATIGISVLVGPEVLSGSTRMKAGTATKMVLNMLTTGAMVRLGKTYGNLMVDLQASNRKLLARSVRIVQQVTGLGATEAEQALAACDGNLKCAIVSVKLKLSPIDARTRLTQSAGRLREALGE
ncbi:MAG TPA: N-acetylmuramic acid 6-phosphate etherase [Woeseiaceae bacterium]|nr:N-acetylmuramic acid 6-phosphate etherase [Woeseiaceae bacterium]